MAVNGIKVEKTSMSGCIRDAESVLHSGYCYAIIDIIMKMSNYALSTSGIRQKKEVSQLRSKITKCAAVLLVLVTLVMCMPAAAMAQGSPQDTTSQSSGVVIATSPSENLASITFSTANSKRVEVGKATTLYVTMHNISSSSALEFLSSDPSVARVEKDGSDRCKVHGLKIGEVTITARVGSMEATYLLYVGDESVTAGGTTTTAAAVTGPAGDFDYFSGTDQDILNQYIIEKKSNDAVSYLFGVIGVAVIVGLCGLVLSVMFRNRSPKMNLYPGSRRRFNTGGYRGNQRKRLLPDHYYRNNKKY